MKIFGYWPEVILYVIAVIVLGVPYITALVIEKLMILLTDYMIEPLLLKMQDRLETIQQDPEKIKQDTKEIK